MLRQLPDRVVAFLESSVVTEFATVSRAGVPIDTPTYCFPSDDLATVDLATGLTNPTKAERARRDPRVGLLLEGAPDEPVVAIRGHATVRDADLQATTERYLAETDYRIISFGLPWEEARKAVWYWGTRILIEVTPQRVLWWDDAAAMDGSPHVWDAPAGTVAPPSDPRPEGAGAPMGWKPRPWPELAGEAVARGAGAHLTVRDDDGYPLPVRARAAERADDGFRLALPAGLPWRATGKATLSFEGVETFVGEAVTDAGGTRLRVERALPQHPAVVDPVQVLQPGDELREVWMARTEVELRRRGVPMPAIPQAPPEPTRLARLRQARLAGAAPVTGVSDERGNRQAG